MKTLEITETDLNQLVNQTTIADEIVLVNRGRQIARLLPPEPDAPLPKPEATHVATATTQPPTFFVAAEGDAMEQEIAAYAALHEELVREYVGRYVAIHQGKVVDYDDDRAALRRRLMVTHPDVIVLVRQVKAGLPTPIHIRSPRIRRSA